ncbi:UDP-2-acetamido-2-deoxy-3-oxo-D-glucuronate aminotransferase [subsurface metagenome]
MVDLYGQYSKIKSEIDSAIQQVIDSSAFIKGPQVNEFQSNLANYLKIKHVIACANGTDALQIALMALDLKPGDEVITPDFTFIATVEVISLLKLKPVLVDVDPTSFNIDPDKVRKAITKNTRAILPVHLYGLCSNMKELLAIARENNLFVVEDNAQAIGGTYNDGQLKGKAGTLGTIGCTSFFPSKNLGCFGDGGALMTNDDALAEKIRCIANHGAKVKYYNDEVGVNSRLDTIQAAILDVKLKYIDQYITNRQKAANYYTDRLNDFENIEIPVIPDYSDHVFHQYTIKYTGDRDGLKKYLSELGIPTMIYYPVPIHAQKAFQVRGSFPITEMLTKTVLSLPMHTELTADQQDYICDKIETFIRK